MPPVIVIRPEPGTAMTVAAARAMGLDARAFPLFAVRALPWSPVPRGEIDAVLLGSANALRHGGPALGAYRGLPAYAVGDRTAQAARDAGLDVVRTGSGGLQSVLGNLAPGHGRLLRLAGREHTILDVPADRTVITREVYASESLPLPAGLAETLEEPAVVLLHSAEAAGHFAAECDRIGIGRARIALACIGPRVAGRAGPGWAALRSAALPNDTALLAMALEICQDFPSGS